MIEVYEEILDGMYYYLVHCPADKKWMYLTSDHDGSLEYTIEVELQYWNEEDLEDINKSYFPSLEALVADVKKQGHDMGEVTLIHTADSFEKAYAFVKLTTLLGD